MQCGKSVHYYLTLMLIKKQLEAHTVSFRSESGFFSVKKPLPYSAYLFLIEKINHGKLAT